LSREFLDGQVQALAARGLTEETCRKFGYRVGKDRRDRMVQIANYWSTDGELVAQHTRTKGKDFAWIGDAKEAGLFGQHLWQAGGKRIVICEGEIDAMSVSQAFGNSWPAVSLPNGAQNAKKAVQRALEYLETFDQIVLAFDMDEPGRAAVAECAPLFSPGKCAVAELPVKDANEMLKAGEVKALCSAIYQARIYRPDGIVSLDDISDRVMAAPESGRPYFLPGLTKATFGRRLGEVIGFGGGTGTGKSDLVCEQVAFDVTTLGITTGVIFLEQTVGETGRRVAGKLASKRFHIPDGSWTEGELATAWEALRATGRLHLYDSWGAANWETVRAKVRFMVQSLGCQHVYLDHLTALAAAEDDERRSLERIMAEMAQDAQGMRFVLHFVSHLATPEGKPHEEGGRVMIRHFKGSRAIGYWSHFLFGVERDTQGPGKPTIIRCLKDRFTGNANGMTWGLHYDRGTGRVSEADLAGFEDESPGGNADF
jgi:twinkle protein